MTHTQPVEFQVSGGGSLPKDLAAALEDCHRAAFDGRATPPLLAEDWSRLLTSPSRHLVGLTEESKVLGFLLSQNITPESEILTFGIRPDCWRHGFGSKLLSQYVRDLRNKYFKKLYLEVELSNIAAVVFYEKHGFKRYGKRPDYYRTPDGMRSDALLYVLDLENQE